MGKWRFSVLYGGLVSTLPENLFGLGVVSQGSKEKYLDLCIGG